MKFYCSERSPESSRRTPARARSPWQSHLLPALALDDRAADGGSLFGAGQPKYCPSAAGSLCPSAARREVARDLLGGARRRLRRLRMSEKADDVQKADQAAWWTWHKKPMLSLIHI